MMKFRRIVAWLIDCVCILAWVVVTAAVGVPLYHAGLIQPAGPVASNLIGAIVVVVPVVFAAAYLDSRDLPGTPGKRVLGLIVLSPTGRPTFPVAFLRDSLKIGVPWLIGHTASFAIVASSATTSSVPIRVWVLTGAAYAVPAIWVVSLFSPSGRTVYDRLSRTGVHRRAELSV